MVCKRFFIVVGKGGLVVNLAYIILSFGLLSYLAAVAFTVLIMSRSHYPERASSLDFKDADTPRFGQSNIVLDLFIETHFSHLITLLSNFSKLLQLFGYKNNLTLCQKYHKLPLLNVFAND